MIYTCTTSHLQLITLTFMLTRNAIPVTCDGMHTHEPLIIPTLYAGTSAGMGFQIVLEGSCFTVFALKR